MRPLDPRLLHRATAARFFLVAVAVVGLATALLVLAQAWFLSQAVASVFDTHDTALARSFGARAGGHLRGPRPAHLGQQRARPAGVRPGQVAAAHRRRRRPAGPSRSTPPSPRPSVSTLVSTELDALDGYFAKYLPQLVLAVAVPVVVVVAIPAGLAHRLIIVAFTIPLIPVFMILIGWTTESRSPGASGCRTGWPTTSPTWSPGCPPCRCSDALAARRRACAGTEDASRTPDHGDAADLVPVRRGARAARHAVGGRRRRHGGVPGGRRRHGPRHQLCSC